MEKGELIRAGRSVNAGHRIRYLAVLAVFGATAAFGSGCGTNLFGRSGESSASAASAARAAYECEERQKLMAYLASLKEEIGSATLQEIMIDGDYVIVSFSNGSRITFRAGGAGASLNGYEYVFHDH